MLQVYFPLILSIMVYYVIYSTDTPLIVRLGRWTRYFNQQKLSIERITINLFKHNLPHHLNNTKIIQISDIHYDSHQSDTYNPETLKNAINFINKEVTISNDNHSIPYLFVLFTGDYVHSDPYKSAIELSTTYLSKLPAQVTKIGITGNHDGKNVNSIMYILNKYSNITMLNNQYIVDKQSGIIFVGLGSLLNNNFKPQNVFPKLKKYLSANYNNSEPLIIVLSHNPDTVECLYDVRSSCNYGTNIDLILSGHTHSGQVAVPYLNIFKQNDNKFKTDYIPLLYYISHIGNYFGLDKYILWLDMANIVKKWEWSSGLIRFDNRYLYVNRGLGSHFNLRINCPPEITVITIQTTAK